MCRYKIGIYSVLLSAVMQFVACEPTVQPPQNTGSYAAGVFVVNEGVFGQTSGTISHYNPTNKAVQQQIFKQTNQRDLGDVVQSLSLYQDKAYIVVNNANKIEVANRNTFQELAQITNLRLPRYCLVLDATKAYVSEWGSDGLTGTIAVLNLTNNTISKRIPVAQGPERLLLKDGLIYCSHPGGFGDNNVVSVLDPTTDQVQKTISVLDRPSSLVTTANGKIWVACSGKIVYTTYPNIDTAASTLGGLVAISPQTQTTVDTLWAAKGRPVQQLQVHPVTQQQLYYQRQGAVWTYDLSNQTTQQLFSGSFYGLAIAPDASYLYAATSSGINAAFAKRYSLTGTLVDSFQVGVFANGFVF